MSAYQNPWTSTGTAAFGKTNLAVEFSYLIDEIEHLTSLAKSQIAMIRDKRSAMSIADMFDLQMSMNKLSQFSEMSTSIISAMNTSVSSMARNVKG